MVLHASFKNKHRLKCNQKNKPRSKVNMAVSIFAKGGTNWSRLSWKLIFRKKSAVGSLTASWSSAPNPKWTVYLVVFFLCVLIRSFTKLRFVCGGVGGWCWSYKKYVDIIYNFFIINSLIVPLYTTKKNSCSSSSLRLVLVCGWATRWNHNDTLLKGANNLVILLLCGNNNKTSLFSPDWWLMRIVWPNWFIVFATWKK